MHRTTPAEPGRTENAGNPCKQPRQRAGRLVGGFCRACSDAGRDQPANVGTAERTAKKNGGDRRAAASQMGTSAGNHSKLGDAGAAGTACGKDRTLTPKGCYFFRRKNK